MVKFGNFENNSQLGFFLRTEISDSFWILLFESILWLLIVSLLKVFVLQFIYDAPSSPLV